MSNVDPTPGSSDGLPEPEGPEAEGRVGDPLPLLLLAIVSVPIVIIIIAVVLNVWR